MDCESLYPAIMKRRDRPDEKIIDMASDCADGFDGYCAAVYTDNVYGKHDSYARRPVFRRGSPLTLCRIIAVGAG